MLDFGEIRPETELVITERAAATSPPNPSAVTNPARSPSSTASSPSTTSPRAKSPAFPGCEIYQP